MRMLPDLVLFDCDGVLVDSEAMTAEIILSNLKRHGLGLTRDELSDFFLGGTLPGVADEVRARGTPLPEDWVDKMYEEIFELLSENVEPVPGVISVLDWLDTMHIPYAVGSNGPHRKMEITLNRTGLAERFAGRIYSREDVAKPKPAPDVYLKAASDAGVSPSRCIVIEDSDNGARAARAAGIYCLGYAAETSPERLEKVCDQLFYSMDELPRLLEQSLTGSQTLQPPV